MDQNEENVVNSPQTEKIWEAPQLEIVEFGQECVIATSDVCFAAGTQVTMADGSVKNIENIKEGEQILTFDHEKGSWAAQEVCIAFHGDHAECAFTLHFEDGTELSIAGIHDLFEKESMKYVRISDEHAEEFIGKHFYSAARKAFIALSSVTRSTEKQEFCSLYTEYHFNSVVNGMLSVPEDVDFLLDFYEFGEDLKADAKTLTADLAKYGVYEYPANAPYTFREYSQWNMRYFNIIVSKGLITRDELIAQYEKNFQQNSGICRKIS